MGTDPHMDPMTTGKPANFSKAVTDVLGFTYVRGTSMVELVPRINQQAANAASCDQILGGAQQ